MKTKSYFADSVDAAIRQAHEELGADAMLVESRTPTGDMRRLGRFEVVVGIPDNGAETHRSRNISAASPREELAIELKMLRGQISDLRKMLQPTPVAPELQDVQQEMIAADLDAGIAETLIQEAEVIWQDRVLNIPGTAARKEALRQTVRECVRRRIQSVPDLNCASARGNVTVFVGPPGVGKTTSIAKIAVQHCLAKRRSVRIISLNTDRVGGHEVMRAYANLLGINFTAANSFFDLNDAMEQNQEKMCVLIDTAGFGFQDMDAARELATILGRIEGNQVHLVLPASMKRADIAEYAEQFSIFKPARLMFTKLDETASVGSILSETLRSGIPLSFFSIGQDVPEDLENGDAELLIGRLFPTPMSSAATAA